MTCKFFLTAFTVLLFSTSLFAQNNYDKSWKKIDSLITQKGLTQSALEEVNKIYASAKKEKNNAQVIKALIYKISLQQKKDPDIINSIKELDKEATISTEPAKSIVQSLEAESYWNYFQQHRYQFYNRTETINFKKDDIATWGIADFHKKISELYLASISQEKLLQQTKLEPFDAIIVKGNVRYLRPALYDLLTHRALEYFKNDERDINRPAYAFELTDSTVFADKNIFSTYHFKTDDSLSLHYKALLLFQQLIQFHLNDAKPDAMLDVDIERITFAKQYYELENKEDLYRKALQNITNEFDNNPVAAQAWYLQAAQYADQAEQYDPIDDTTDRYAYVQAKDICNHVLQQIFRDSSEGKTNCMRLLKNIQSQELQLKTEIVNVPGQPFRALVSYRNLNQIYFRIIKLNKKIKQDLNIAQAKNEYWKGLVSLSPFRSFGQALPDTKDYQQHNVEIKIDSLEPGEYTLLAGVDEDFALTKNILSVQSFYVSNISYVKNGDDYFVLNRETGHPLQGADVQVWYNYYDARQSKYLQRKGEQFSTSKDGFFHIASPKTKTRNNFQLEFKYGADDLFMDNQQDYEPYYRVEDDDNIVDRNLYEKNNLRTFIFLDRSIYRPAQTVFFKGIIVTKDFLTHQYKVLPNFKTKVILYNANNERIDSISLITNEFGSYHAKFKLPEGQMNGLFKIEDDSTHASQSFSVEEYKRPKFYITYDTIKDSYRVRDHIKIVGNVKAYAGNTIAGAIVKYRVVRQTNFLYLSYGISKLRTRSDQEITHGEIKTDDMGKFKFEFIALPDNSSKASDPIFDYRVISDITDINGETHSEETIVHVSYKSLKLYIKSPDENNLSSDSLKNILIETTNFSGHFEPAKINLCIYKLKSPERLIRGRYWKQADQFVMTEQEYIKYFPNDEYRNETKKESWQRTTKVFEITDTTKQNKKIDLQGTGLKAGWYLIEVTAKDNYGEDVKATKYVQLFDSKTGDPGSPSYNWITESSQLVAPGNTATLTIGSSTKDLFVIQKLDRGNNTAKMNDDTIHQYSFFNVSAEKKAIEMSITDSDRGGLEASFAFIKNNRLFTSISSVIVPWTNKELSINYETYRDKTLPGSEEKWKIKITGYKKDKVTAEALVGMYDASLDQFKPQYWAKPNIYDSYFGRNNWSGKNNFYFVQSYQKEREYYLGDYFDKTYDAIVKPEEYYHTEGLYRKSAISPAAAGGRNDISFNFTTTNYTQSGEMFVMGEKLKKEPSKSESNGSQKSQIQIRKNFSETAFFFPDLKTDSSGNVEFSFSMPEALTQWKWMTFAHTKDLSMGYDEKTIITQKQLMVQPNAPRFLREGDKMEFSTKIVNMTDSALSGSVILQLIDPTTNQPVDTRFSNSKPNQNFTAGSKQSISINFPIEIPYNYNQPLTYRIIATGNTSPLSSRRGDGGEVSDGEEATLPVLNNRTLVTESIPINVNSPGTKKFTFEKLLHSGESKTLSHQSLTVEFTSNPAWYAVQALPYLMEYPYECSEQNFNRFYANALASMIANSSPRIKEVFDRWKNSDTAALMSNLQKNEELKSLLLQETPWVLQAKNESAQKKNIALLFDMLRMNKELESSFSKLQNMQLENGGFSWFKDGPDDRYITQYILTGIGHLKKMNALPSAFAAKIKNTASLAIAYLDKKIKADYDELLKRKKKNPQLDELGNIQIQYLYMRSFFSDYPIPGDAFPAINYYRKQAQQSWLKQSRFMQGMIALSLYRTGDIKTANDILASLKQNATIDDEMGMYWKDIRYGYYWYESPIETQSLLIEAFQEINKNDKITNNLKTWLLKQKQTQNWQTTKATADACYALLVQGTNLLTDNSDVEITLGNKIIQSKNETTEAGTGYFKKIIPGDSVKPIFGNVSVSVSSPTGGGRVGAWGAIYWQYFENLDKITSSSTTKMPLTLVKKLFVEKNTDRGPVLEPVTDNSTLKIGDKIKVRIELRVDRDMEYVHMKDMRASSSEPINVISKYNWQGGLGYYESTKDASTNFFFSWLPKGTHVFEYPLFVTTAGNFSNGITTIQCMYAPEFNAHSDGVRITVTK